MPPCNILFTSSGRRVALVQLFRKAMDEACPAGRIVTADRKRSAPTHCAADDHDIVPPVSDPGYVDRLKEICERRKIRLLIPLIDPELDVLAPYREAFAAIGTTLLVSSPEVTKLCFDKRLTGDFFRSIGVATPAILDPQAFFADPDARYPVLLKPAFGSSSKGVTKIRNARELAFFMEYVPHPVVQELLAGDEYTLDILADERGKVRCVVPRLRIETRDGEISKGVTVKNTVLMEAGKCIVESLPGAVGPITLQCFLQPNGSPSFIEINPRFGGGFPLSAEAGADFPRWLIETAMGREPAIAFDGWREDVVMLRYDAAFYMGPQCLAPS